MFFQRDWARRADAHYQNGNLRKAADAYRRAKRWGQAIQTLRELGEIDEAVDLYRELERPLDAAALLIAEGRPIEAATHFEAGGALRQAAEACVDGKRLTRAGRLFERAELFERAAQVYLETGEVEQALGALEKEHESLAEAGADESPQGLEQRQRRLAQQRAQLLTQLKRHGDAGRLLFDHGAPLDAAPHFEAAEDFAAAARAWHEAGRLADAARALERAESPDPEIAAQVYSETGEPFKAAELFERLGRLPAAAAAYEEAGSLSHAATLWEREKNFARAAELFETVGKLYDAAQAWARAGDDHRAAELFEQANAPRNAADAWAALDQPFRAGDLYMQAGADDEAREMLLAIGPEDADYAHASLLLAPLLLEIGDKMAAEERLELIKASAGRLKFPRHEVLYFQARTAEAHGHLEAAAKGYQRVLGLVQDFRDTVRRLDDVKERVAARPPLRDTGRIAAAGPAAMAAAGLRNASVNSTQRVRLKPSAASTGSRNKMDSEALDETSSGRQRLSSGDASDLPVVLTERIEPWWSGSKFFSARRKSDDSEVLLAVFPLAEVSDRVDGFASVMRQVEALKHKAILRLESFEIHSDKVLLYYEVFDGMPLDNALAEGRTYSPRDALHLIIQLCEALTNAHKLGITHQWLSPRTVLVGAGAECKLSGIGLREFLADRDSVAGAYLSPEVSERGVIGPTSDVYSLGLLAMTLLDAILPALDRSEPVQPEDVTWPAEVREEVPSSLRSFLVRCIDPDPLERPSTAEMSAALAALGFIGGQLLADRWEVVQEIGRGGMSRVYEATDREFGEPVAIKTVLAPALGRTEDEERLLREVQISRRISHPNVVRVYDLGRFPGGIFIIMELLDGPGLDEVIRDQGPLEIERVRGLMIEIAEALAEAHRLSIIHRDLKPGNVILVDGRAKVLDFGIARMADGSPSHLTRTGEVMGSPLFMAPEQIQGLPLTGACDLYALGVIGYTMLTGVEPFTGDSPTAIVLKHLHEQPPDIRKLRPDLDQPWVDLLQRLLAKKPDERFGDAKELAEELRALPAPQVAESAADALDEAAEDDEEPTVDSLRDDDPRDDSQRDTD
ncbi:MAG: protein kinase [Acidobacteriota bacterium]